MNFALTNPSGKGSRVTITRSLILISTMMVCLSGCYTTSFHGDTKALRGSEDGQVRYASSVFAIVPLDNAINLRDLCPSGVSKIIVKQSFFDGLIHYITIGFYSLQTAQVWCTRQAQTGI